jgi:hypothetical protein
MKVEKVAGRETCRAATNIPATNNKRNSACHPELRKTGAITQAEAGGPRKICTSVEPFN